MPTKTDRILSYLPGTFRARLPVTGAPSALYAIARAFGTELQQAENKLAEIVRSHWAGTADHSAPELMDLAAFAALYGLLPRDDEGVEEFREHLFRYVRTFLEGTVTVQGILRVTAEALGITIADAAPDLDTWWERGGDELADTIPDARDAAELVLGLQHAVAQGRPALPARLEGIVDIGDGVDLRAASILRIQVDDLATAAIDLVSPGSPPEQVTAEAMASRINAVFEPQLGRPVASAEHRRLVVVSPSTGPSSRLEFEEGDGDAAMRALGLRPLAYFGSEPRPAVVTGSVDLSGDLDLREARYLRVVVDGSHTAEVDLGGPTPGHRSVEEIGDSINAALGMPIASIVEESERSFLRLTSPTVGASSSLAFPAAGAQDAATRVLGAHPPVSLGADASSASVQSPELDAELDLSLRYNLRLSIDDAVALTVNCAGLRPERSTVDEVVAAINAAVGEQVALRVGRRLQLTSATTGITSQVRFETPDEADATELLFGLPPRVRRGTAPSSVRIVGHPELDEVDLRARHLLRVRVDGGPPVVVDLRQGVTRPGFQPKKAILADLVEATRAALGPDTATDDGLHFILASPTIGHVSKLEVLPLEIDRRRRFVSRAIVTGEASGALLGFDERVARGTDATNARLVGTVDLSHGVDLRATRYLRIGLDGHPAMDIDCAGPRPRATLLSEVVERINAKLRDHHSPPADVAFSDGRHLVLASSVLGSESEIRFEAPRAQDALDLLLGFEPTTVFGANASGVDVVGVPDLGQGVDLPAQAALQIGVDGAPAVQIPLTADTPARVTLSEILVALSVQLGSSIARREGSRLALRSPSTGASATLSFEAPTGNDATPLVLGFVPPRTYQGADTRPATLRGSVDLTSPSDLSLQRFLRVAVDGRPPVSIDCAPPARRTASPSSGETPAPDPARETSLDDVVERINAALKADVATADDGYLRLTSTTSGISSSIDIEHHTGGDARETLLGNVEDESLGVEPGPAILEGDLALLGPVDLRDRGWLRIAVDGGRPHDVEVRGATPATTFLDEVASKLDEVVPGLATITSDDRLRLASPTVGPSSSVAVLPLRTIDIVEFPPEPTELPAQPVRHGARLRPANDGASEVPVTMGFDAPDGAVMPALANAATGWRLRLLATLRPGESARVFEDTRGRLLATLCDAAGNAHQLPPGRVAAAPWDGRASVPFVGEWLLTGSSVGPARIVLDDAVAPAVVDLHALRSGPSQPTIGVSVVASKPAATLPEHYGDGTDARVLGRLRWGSDGFSLEGQDGAVLARVRNGIDGGLDDFTDQVVAASGPLFAPAFEGEPWLCVVERIERVFDVAITASAGAAPETYPIVTIGGPDDADSLVTRVNRSSLVVRARSVQKSEALRLPRGQAGLRYLDSVSNRFNEADFDEARFAGGQVVERGIFDVSRFDNTPPESTRTVFASAAGPTEPDVFVDLAWVEHRPGAFEVQLPKDLPESFGGRFNAGRFGRRGDQDELYEHVVTEPLDDEKHIVTVVSQQSELVTAAVVPRVPLGWVPQALPFRKPRYLTLGSEETPARMYLSDEGLDGFIELRARSEGAWGNSVAVSVRQAGPALFDLRIAFAGAVFERARQVAAGHARFPDRVLDVLAPGPVGVTFAKAAGVLATVTREGTEPPAQSGSSVDPFGLGGAPPE